MDQTVVQPSDNLSLTITGPTLAILAARTQYHTNLTSLSTLNHYRTSLTSLTISTGPTTTATTETTLTTDWSRLW